MVAGSVKMSTLKVNRLLFIISDLNKRSRLPRHQTLAVGKLLVIIISDLNKRSQLPIDQILAVGNFPLVRSQLTLGTRGERHRHCVYLQTWLFLQKTGLATQGKKNGRT